VRNAGIVDEVVKALGAQATQCLPHARDEIVKCADIRRVELQGSGLGSRLAG